MKLQSLATGARQAGPVTGYVTPAAPLRAFVAELVAAGVREAIVCPGSRSMPLALALRAHPGLRVMVHLDERALPSWPSAWPRRADGRWRSWARPARRS